MNPNEARFNHNPILTGIFESIAQSGFIATEVLPSFPQKLGVSLFGETGLDALRRYELSRAPGTNTKRITITIKGTTYTLKQKSVEVPIPRETLREANVYQSLNVGAHLDVSQVAMTTASDVLALDYELDVSDLLKEPTTYPAANVINFTAATQWSAPTSDPVGDIDRGRKIIRQSTGVKPDTLTLGPEVEAVLLRHPQIIGLMSSTNDKIVTHEHLKRFFKVDRILVGESIWADDEDNKLDVWGNMALLSFSPKITIATASAMRAPFGITSVMEGHPFAEDPYFERQTKSWIYGGTYERLPNLTRPGAGVLFNQPIAE